MDMARSGRRPPWERFANAVRGGAAAEFALILAPFLIFILGGVQLGILFFANSTLQSVGTFAARQLMVGSVQLAGMNQSQYHTLVCGHLPSLFQCNQVMIDVESASSYSSINTSPIAIKYDQNGNPTNNWSFSPGNPGDIVIVRIMYNWPVIGGPFAVGLANQPNGAHLLVATAVIKNEPYQ